MKRLFSTALVLAFAASFALAQTPDELRIYINPGHGSWTGNDRALQVIGKPEYSSTNTDTTGFFESNTNLEKGFGVLEKLIEIGFPFDRTLNQTGERWEIGAAKDLSNNLVMSRVKNGPFEAENTTSSPNYMLYNRSLLEIATEVEYNEFDMFISIHSNAASSNGVNYHLYMYRGRNGRDNAAVEGSYEMCEAGSVYSFANEHAQWSESSTYIYGDVDFMGGGSGSTNSLGYYGYLGVLKHGTPGYLVEGYFHTHTPSRHRAMNWDVDRIEGYQYARGVAEYFQFEERDKTGEIYGIVRDAHVKFSHALWIPVAGTDDVLKPINGCSVFLHKDGEVIGEYLTDDFYNGAFVFYNLEPGTYTLTFSHPEYEESDPVEVEVAAGLTTYPKVYLTDIYYNGRPGEEMNYPNPVPTEYTIAEAYDLSANYSEKEIVFSGTPKRLIWNKGFTYILAIDEANNPSVVVLDDLSGNILRTVSTAACDGMMMDVADIQVTADGFLVACTKAKNQYSDKYVEDGDVRGTVTFYIWDKDEYGLPVGEPKEFFSTQSAGEWYRSYTGDTFAYRGTYEEGEIVMSSVSTATATGIRNSVFEVVNGEVTLEGVSRPSKLLQKDLGDDFRFTVSPINRHQFFVQDLGDKYGMREYNFMHEAVVANSETPTSLPLQTTGAGFFKYGNYVLMTFATPDSKNIQLYNISQGIGQPTAIALTGNEVPSDATTALTTGYPLVFTDADGNVTDATFKLLLLRDNKLSRFSVVGYDGVSSVTLDNPDLPIVFYDLFGRPVNASALSPGIYIRVQGTNASKVLVK